MKNIFLMFLKVYKNALSLLIESVFGGGCRFTPTCSEYAEEAIGKHGFLKGTSLSLKRLLRCNPLGGRGVDHVPDRL